MASRNLFSCIAAILAFSVAMYGPPTQAQQAAVLLKDEPVEYLGGVPGFETKDDVNGDLTISTEAITFVSSKGEFTIDPKHVTFLSSGEFAKRRVKGALIGAILLTPLFLFMLIGKKKRDILLIEYSEKKHEVAEGEQPPLTGAAILRYKPKGGRAVAIEQAISRVTGLAIVKEVPEGYEESQNEETAEESQSDDKDTAE